MNLREVLKGIDYELIKGDVNKEVLDIQYNSMNVKEDSLFVAIEGYSTDGHKYIKSAIEKGAKIIVCSKDIEEINGNYTLLKVGDGRKALATISSNYYGNPKDKLKIIGVTGTNGKTTTTFMIKSILEEAGYKVGLLGTISNYIGNKRVPAERTTPESLEMHMLFKDMVEEGVEYCVMEVSSHSLYLDRVHGIEFEEGIFTNLTQDHLDFHETFDNYYKAKFILFQNSKKSIINIDDEYGMKLLKDINNDFFTYSTKELSNLCAYNIQMHPRGIKFTVDYENEKEEIDIHIPGRYNISNALGAILACLNEGISLNLAKKGLENLSGVPGRCEIVTKDYELGYDVIVDYAHTPDGLDNILKTAREFTKGRLISIFGCGGDRDKTKRPIMGSIGTELSDISIITSDNPRTEDPLKIIEDILSGIKKENFIVEENRREAIKKAMEMARKGDVIVLAGKGHEDYQILKDKTIHFDEREVVKEIIEELYAN